METLTAALSLFLDPMAAQVFAPVLGVAVIAGASAVLASALSRF